VSQAPTIDHWRVIAFRQRAEEHFTLKHQRLLLDPTKMFFTPIISDHTLDVIVYGENVNQYDTKIVGYYGLVMMDNLIGEYDCVMSVRHYDFQDISEMPEDAKGNILSNFPHFLDEFKRSTTLKH
jgi:hypothetical protein